MLEPIYRIEFFLDAILPFDELNRFEATLRERFMEKLLEA